MMKVMKEDPELYSEALQNVRGEGFHDKYKKSMTEYNKDAALMAAKNHHAHAKVAQNVRVRLPTKDQRELSDDSDQDEEDLGRSKIKKDAEMRRTGQKFFG